MCCPCTLFVHFAGMESSTMVLVLILLSTGCNVLCLVFKSNTRQTIMYLYLTPNKVLKANHVSSSQSDRSKRVTCRCIKSLNAHIVSLNAHFVKHKNAKATRRALKHLDHMLRCTKRYKARGPGQYSITVEMRDNARAELLLRSTFKYK